MRTSRGDRKAIPEEQCSPNASCSSAKGLCGSYPNAKVDRYAVRVAGLDQPFRMPDRIMLVATGSKPETVGGEMRLTERRKHLNQHLLLPAVKDRRDPKKPDASGGLRNFFATNRERSIRTAKKIPADLIAVPVEVTAQLVHVHPVNPGRAFVRYYTSPGTLHV